MTEDYRALADQVASDIGPVVDLTLEEAKMATRFVLPNETADRVDAIAQVLFDSYRSETWS